MTRREFAWAVGFGCSWIIYALSLMLAVRGMYLAAIYWLLAAWFLRWLTDKIPFALATEGRRE